MEELTDNEIKLLKKFIAEVKLAVIEIMKNDGTVRQINFDSIIKNMLKEDN